MNAALLGVEMRILFVGNDRRRQLDNLPRNVGVEIVRDDDGNLVAEDLAHSPHHFRIGVRMALDHHGAVQIKQHAVELRRGLQALDQLLRQNVERFVGYRADCLWSGKNRRIEVEPVEPSPFDVARRRICAPLMGLDHLLTARDSFCRPQALLEIGKRRLLRIERVRFVTDPAQTDERIAALRGDRRRKEKEANRCSQHHVIVTRAPRDLVARASRRAASTSG